VFDGKCSIVIILLYALQKVSKLSKVIISFKTLPNFSRLFWFFLWYEYQNFQLEFKLWYNYIYITYVKRRGYKLSELEYKLLLLRFDLNKESFFWEKFIELMELVSLEIGEVFSCSEPYPVVICSPFSEAHALVILSKDTPASPALYSMDVRVYWSSEPDRNHHFAVENFLCAAPFLYNLAKEQLVITTNFSSHVMMSLLSGKTICLTK
jgi:hypothetical protein